jgi:Ca2+-binding RTX toxin-like protein
VASESEAIVELVGEGTDEVQCDSSYSLDDLLTTQFAYVENLRLMGLAADNLNGWGNSLDNQLIGDAGNNHLYGHAGNDSLDGGAGNDTMVGGLGDDTYVVAQAGDVVSENLNQGTDLVQSSITYTLGSNVENLTLTDAGNINGTGNTLGNIITGNAGNNSLDGGDGRDTLDGGLGNDTLLGGALQDSLTGGGGNDSLDGGSEDDYLIGTSDVLFGANEIDTLTGAAGGDVFVLGDATAAYYNTAAAAGDYALITDFSVATNDQLQLKTLAASGTNVNGYVVGANIYAAAGAANSWLYRDTDNSGGPLPTFGDNLIAAIQSTGGALTTNDLNTAAYFV